LFAGFRYVWSEKIVLGAISLDLFAVLLGGAMALLPVYARDILDAGPWGLGLLRAAPGFGALIVAAWLARNTIRDHAGLIMFIFVAGFGFFTALFGASTMVWLSVLALALAGACDMISVYVRETLIQLWTPDEVTWARQCCEHGVHRRLERAGRVPCRYFSVFLRRRAGGRRGRAGNDSCRGALGLVVSAAAPGAPPRR
jgi:MFS family permease